MRSARSIGLAVVLALPFTSACVVDLGECDMAAAEEVVFLDTGSYLDSQNGWPMYAGQGLVATSCGYAQFCHASEATGALRYGAPGGLDFDLALACENRDCDVQDKNGLLAKLRHNQRNLLEHAGLVYRSVRSGSMPPGDAGSHVNEQSPTFRRVPFGLSTFDLLCHYEDPDSTTPCAPGSVNPALENERLPATGSDAGIEIIRNWLACGAPIVESTQSGGTPGSSCAVDELGHQGQCLYRLDAPVDVTLLFYDADGPTGPMPPDLNKPYWPNIYDNFLHDRCGVSCHNPTDPTYDRNLLDLSEMGAAYESLVTDGVVRGVLADGTSDNVRCLTARFGAHPTSANPNPAWPLFIVPGDPDASYFIEKLAGVTTDGSEFCGDRMAQGRPAYPKSVLDALRLWVTQGALEN